MRERVCREGGRKGGSKNKAGREWVGSQKETPHSLGGGEPAEWEGLRMKGTCNV